MVIIRKSVCINFIVVLTFLFLSQCTGKGPYPGPYYKKNGKKYPEIDGIFRFKPWDFYKIGLSFADGEYYEEAIKNFNKAIEKDKIDKWKKRTYGVRTINYFPNRECGISFYKIGNMKKAKEFLEKSLNFESTSKAQYYLDLVRIRIFENKLNNNSKLSGPIVYIDQKKILLIRNNNFNVSGYVEDNRYIKKIYAVLTNLKSKTKVTKDVFMEESKQKIYYNIPFEVEQGKYKLEIISENLMAKSTTKKIFVNIDREGPIIDIEKLIVTQQSIEIDGFLYDRNNVKKFSINQKNYEIKKKNSKVYFSKKIMLDNSDKILLVAYDNFGNYTKGEISLKSIHTTIPQNSLLLASNEYNPHVYNNLKIENIILNLQDTPEKIYGDEIYIDGNVRGINNKIKRIAIIVTNKFETKNYDVLIKPGKMLFFGHPIKLKKDNENPIENLITIIVEDVRNNIIQRQITVLTECRKMYSLHERLSFFIYPFKNNNISSSNSYLFRKYLNDSISTKEIQVGIQRFKGINERNIEESANCEIVGEIFERKNGVEISAQVIDNEINETIAKIDVYDEITEDKSNSDIFKSLANGLTLKLINRFPLVNGNINDVSLNYITTDLGFNKVKNNKKLSIYSELPSIQKKGEAIIRDKFTKYSNATVKENFTEYSCGNFIVKKAGHINITDKVITQ